MVMLVTVKSVRDRLSLPDQADVNEAIVSALSAIHIELESLLDSKFDIQESVTDVFEVNVDFFWRSLPQNLASLLLRTGFVSRVSLNVNSYDTLEYALAGTPVVDFTALSTYSVDAIKGVVRVSTALYDQKYISVTYTSGFENAADETIPPWLKEVILAKVPRALQTQTPSNHTAEAIALAKVSDDHASIILTPYFRKNIPFAFRPVY